MDLHDQFVGRVSDDGERPLPFACQRIAPIFPNPRDTERLAGGTRDYVTLPIVVLLKEAVHRHYAASSAIGVPEPLLFGDGLGARMDRREVRTLLAEVRDQTPAQKPFHGLTRLGVPPADELRFVGPGLAIHWGTRCGTAIESQRTRIRSGQTYIRGRCL